MTKAFVFVCFVLYACAHSQSNYTLDDFYEVITISNFENYSLVLQKPTISSFDWITFQVKFRESEEISYYKIHVGAQEFISNSSQFTYSCEIGSSGVELAYQLVNKKLEISKYSDPIRIEWGNVLLSKCNTFKKSKRKLIASADVQKSVITGTGLGPSVVAMTSYTVNVQARDINNNVLGSGGDVFKIKIYNKCVIGVGQTWVAVGGAKQVFASNIDATMTDNGDGTYSYIYTPQQSGEITVSVYLEDSVGVYAEHFSNSAWSGNPAAVKSFYNVDINWGTGDIYPGRADNVASYFYMKLRAPVTGSYTFTLDHDDGSDLIFNGVTRINRSGTGWVWNDSFTVSLTAGQFYLIKIKHLEMTIGALLKLYWAYPGQVKTIIPSKRKYNDFSWEHVLHSSCGEHSLPSDDFLSHWVHWNSGIISLQLSFWQNLRRWNCYRKRGMWWRRNN
jgi:hypothetical protein